MGGTESIVLAHTAVHICTYMGTCSSPVVGRGIFMPLLINGECVSRHIWMHACSICVNTGRAHACVCIVYTCLRISDICVCLVV